jgi:hypothetical protein
MKKRNRCLTENEIKVKNLLADIYDYESKIFLDIHRTQTQLNQLKEAASHHKKIRRKLIDSFNALQEAESNLWDSKKSEVEMALTNAEGDKEIFIESAESYTKIINEKIE